MRQYTDEELDGMSTKRLQVLRDQIKEELKAKLALLTALPAGTFVPEINKPQHQN